MLGWEFPPHSTGGLGIACLGLAQALSHSQNADISFVLPRKINVSHPLINFLFADIPDTKSEEYQNTIASSYMSREEYEKRLAAGEDVAFGSSIIEEVRLYARHIKKIARSEQFDVIHAHDWLSMLAGVEAKKVSGKPLVVHVHATSFDQAGGDNVNPATYAIEKYGMEEADTVIAVSEYTKNLIIAKYGIDPNKIRIVHNGVFCAHAGEGNGGNLLRLKESGNKIVLYFGRITLQKGIDYFISAAQKVLQHEPNTYFVVAGTGDMEGQIMRQAADLGISDRVLFHMGKYVDGDDRANIFAAADLYVMPSISEPFGIVPLEMLLEAGTPALISKQSGVSEVMKHALKVDFWDTDEMANKIVAVLRNDCLKEQLSEYGTKEAQGVTWDKAAGKCHAIYQDLINLFRPKVS